MHVGANVGDVVGDILGGNTTTLDVITPNCSDPGSAFAESKLKRRDTELSEFAVVNAVLGT